MGQFSITSKTTTHDHIESEIPPIADRRRRRGTAHQQNSANRLPAPTPALPGRGRHGQLPRIRPSHHQPPEGHRARAAGGDLHVVGQQLHALPWRAGRRGDGRDGRRDDGSLRGLSAADGGSSQHLLILYAQPACHLQPCRGVRTDRRPRTVPPRLHRHRQDCQACRPAHRHQPHQGTRPAATVTVGASPRPLHVQLLHAGDVVHRHGLPPEEGPARRHPRLSPPEDRPAAVHQVGAAHAGHHRPPPPRPARPICCPSSRRRAAGGEGNTSTPSTSSTRASRSSAAASNRPSRSAPTSRATAGRA